jgi:hypothetical protein
MTRKLTKTQERIVGRMRELITGGIWEMIPGRGDTIRLTREVETPAYAREDRPGRPGSALWGQETYTEVLFVTFVNGTVIKGHGSCPWVGRSDQDIPFWYAEMILNADDPWTVVENWAQIKDARKAARS